MSGSDLICASRGNLTCYVVGSSDLKGGSGSLLKYARTGDHDDQGQQQLRLGGEGRHSCCLSL
jgi:hypothetical protein